MALVPPAWGGTGASILITMGPAATTWRGVAVALLVAATAAVDADVALAGRAEVAAGAIWVETADSEANDLRVTTEPDSVLLVDQGARLEPGAGCSAAGPAGVRCTRLPLVVDLGPGADRATFELPRDLEAQVYAGEGDDEVGVSGGTIFGGPGDDVLRAGPHRASLAGGAGTDRLQGGPSDDYLSARDRDGPEVETAGDGPDVLVGGGGIDTVGYGDLSPVHVTLDGVANDGHAGEGDMIAADVEAIEGGRGSDVLVGNAGPNVIRGGAGDDRIEGRDQGDQLDGGSGDDDVAGGDGHDELTGSAGADRLDAGAGEDKVKADENLRGCSDANGPRPCPGDRAGADAVTCGAGSDYVLASDPDDRIDDTCEDPLGRPWSQRVTPNPTLPPGARLRVRGRALHVPLRCAAAAGVRCSGTIEISARLGGRTRRLASLSATFAPGATTLRLPLEPSVRRRISRRRRLTVSVRITGFAGTSVHAVRVRR